MKILPKKIIPYIKNSIKNIRTNTNKKLNE